MGSQPVDYKHVEKILQLVIPLVYLPLTHHLISLRIRRFSYNHTCACPLGWVFMSLFYSDFVNPAPLAFIRVLT